MAIPVWPASLPQKALVQGYSESYPNTMISFKVDSGVPKSRRKGANIPFPISVNLNITSGQLNDLEDFVTGPLEGGALMFYFTHPRKRESILVQLVAESEDKLYTITARGLDAYLVKLKMIILP